MAQTPARCSRCATVGAVASNRGPTTADISLFVELSRALVAVSVRSVGAIDGVVTLPQFRALAVLERRGPCSAGELATGVGLLLYGSQLEHPNRPRINTGKAGTLFTKLRTWYRGEF